jgi:hypothetical protein
MHHAAIATTTTTTATVVTASTRRGCAGGAATARPNRAVTGRRRATAMARGATGVVAPVGMMARNRALACAGWR